MKPSPLRHWVINMLLSQRSAGGRHLGSTDVGDRRESGGVKAVCRWVGIYRNPYRPDNKPAVYANLPS